MRCGSGHVGTPGWIVGGVPVSASIGIQVANDDDDYDSLLRWADSAMYDAKRSGRGCIRSPQAWRPGLHPVLPGLATWASGGFG
jgi:Diguanylate cyclase, GGDEF domain